MPTTVTTSVVITSATPTRMYLFIEPFPSLTRALSDACGFATCWDPRSLLTSNFVQPVPPRQSRPTHIRGTCDHAQSDVRIAVTANASTRW